jgi:hypothetical protein
MGLPNIAPGRRRAAGVTTRPRGGRAFLIACAVAGLLAMPLHAVATPVSAIIGGTVGLLGLRMGQWAGLPRRLPSKDRQWPSRFVECALWWGLGLLFGLVLLLVLRTVILGNVFATRGIVAAIWMHAGADCAIQLLGPLTR